MQALRLLPMDCRVRASAVCRAWRDAAADPTLLHDIWFSATEDIKARRLSFYVNGRDLRRLCARAGTALRTMDLSAPYACLNVDAGQVVAALQAGGCTGLQRLTFPDYSHDLSNIHQACLTQHDRELLNIACPALQFCDCAVNCESAIHVAPALAIAPGPRWLTMSDPNPEGAMRAAFAPHPQVTGLVLRWCVQEAQLLREALQLNTALEALVLDGCELVLEHVAALGEALRTNKKLDFLSLKDNLLGEAGVAALCEGLCANSTLSELWLTSTGLSDVSAAVLGQALRTHTTLETLRLDDNNIGDDGATALSQALRANTFRLCTLDLESNLISDTGAASLGKALQENTWLKVLQLMDNHIGDAGAASLGAALRVNTTLKTLTIDENPIGNDGEDALARGVRRNIAIDPIELNGKVIEPGLG